MILVVEYSARLVISDYFFFFILEARASLVGVRNGSIVVPRFCCWSFFLSLDLGIGRSLGS